ncbi:MAG: hypothetical protein M3065_07405, partial [Actinomycetota bacterium]|nr:hypothetical protein [Actinomycetota bacterium]
MVIAANGPNWLANLEVGPTVVGDVGIQRSQEGDLEEDVDDGADLHRADDGKGMLRLGLRVSPPNWIVCSKP